MELLIVLGALVLANLVVLLAAADTRDGCDWRGGCLPPPGRRLY